MQLISETPLAFSSSGTKAAWFRWTTVPPRKNPPTLKVARWGERAGPAVPIICRRSGRVPRFRSFVRGPGGFSGSDRLQGLGRVPRFRSFVRGSGRVPGFRSSAGSCVLGAGRGPASRTYRRARVARGRRAHFIKPRRFALGNKQNAMLRIVQNFTKKG